jgi:hypothetical protein
MTAVAADRVVEKLGNFISLGKDIRDATTRQALAFTLCNRTRRLIRYDTALLLQRNRNGAQTVRCISGVSEFDPRAPLAELCESLVNCEDVYLEDTTVHQAGHLPGFLARAMRELQIEQIVCSSLGGNQATLVMIRFQEWSLTELQLVKQVAEVADHAWSALPREQAKHALYRKLSGVRAAKGIGLGLLMASMLLPVRQSVIASGQVIAIDPGVVASGLNGVIHEIHVRPNQSVTKGTLLVTYDQTELRSRYSTVTEELNLAREQYRKARQQSLSAVQGAAQRFAELESDIEQKTIELNRIDDMLKRAEITAQQDGVAIFGRAQDWEGRAVSIGEKIMEISDPAQQQFEIWLASADTISFEQGARVKFFPDAFPLRSVSGAVESVGYFPMQKGADELAFRVLASPAAHDEDLRLGMNGTTRLYGDRVSLGYYLFRKPLAATRRWLGV